MKEDFTEQIYTKDIFNTKGNIYNTWLRKVSQKELLMSILREELKNSDLFENKDEEKRIIDIGCGWGSTSLKFMDVLKENNIRYQYTALEPYKIQLKKFKEILKKQKRKNIILIEGKAEDFSFDKTYDFAFFSHSLYYVNNMLYVLRKTISHSKEICIVHHGEGGINTVHKNFSAWVKKGPHIISTYDDVIEYLELLKKEGMKFKYTVLRFSSKIDVTECKDPSSQDGKNLISFFLERDYKTIPENIRKEIHRFFREKIGDELVHDEAIILIKTAL